MNKAELGRYRQLLEERKRELERSLGRIEDIAVEREPDELDDSRLAGERDLAVGKLNREAVLLREVKGALGRLAGGEYGICLNCEQEISVKRLAAVPWAALCIKCQEAADNHRQRDIEDTLERSIPDAA